MLRCFDPSYDINFDESDHYLYNGQKLIYSDPNQGGDGYYHTERENFERIEGFNLDTASPYWVVTQKDGTRLYFGYQALEHTSTSDGCIVAEHNGAAWLWSLSKVEDVHGNYYIVEYHEDLAGGDYYPVRITYTKNESLPLSAYRTVEFSYEERTDHGPKYSIAKMDMDKRLKWITVKMGGNLLRKYRLDYEYSGSTGRSRLVAIQEYGSDGNMPSLPWVDGSYVATGSILPEERFEWGENLKGWETYPSILTFSPGQGYSNASTYPIYVGDWNGDGRTDVGRTCSSGVSFRISTGEGWETYPSIATFSPGQGYNNASTYPIYVGDWNGDGRTDVGRTCSSGVMFRKNKTGNMLNIQDLLINISIFYKGVFQINYKIIPQLDGSIQPSQSTYPFIANKSPRLLVTKIEIDPGIGPPMSYRYEYSNGMIYMGKSHEMANLGFEWVKKIDDATGRYKVTHYRQDRKYYRGLVLKEEAYGSNGRKYLETQYEYANRIERAETEEYHAVRFIYKTMEKTFNYNGDDTNPPVEYRVEYDEPDYKGNLTRIYHHGDFHTAYDETEIITEYGENSTKNIFVPVKVITNSYDLDGLWGRASEQRNFYDDYSTSGDVEYGLVTRNEIENNGDDTVITYGYDTNGNLIWTKDPRVTSGEYDGYTSRISYDPYYKTYPVTDTNILGHTRTISYDYVMSPITVTDENGSSFITEYDEFGRITATRNPGDETGIPTTEIIYNDMASPMHTITKMKESDTGTLDSYIYFDSLGRKVQEKREAVIAGEWIAVDYHYNQNGQNYKTSVPYTSLSEVYNHNDERNSTERKYKELEYDAMGRAVETINTDGTGRKTKYGKKNILSLDENGHMIREKTDGNTAYKYTYEGDYSAAWESLDPDNILYDAYSLTETKSARDGTRIIDNQGNVIQTELDMLARKTSYTDPDMGTWIYTYDANNNLKSNTDAKGNTIYFEYDKLNRVIIRDLPAGEDTVYTYDEAGHGAGTGRLTSVTYDVGSESYIYDSRGRVTRITRTIGMETRELEMTYDPMGRMVTETYPDGEVLTYTYRNDGNLGQLTGDNTYISNIGYTASGKVAGFTYGNGTRTAYSYYDAPVFSYRLKEIDISLAGNRIGHTCYEYDSLDNITRKEFYDDFGSSYTENFTYDSLNRLAAYDTNITGTTVYKEYAYDELNNIIEKDGRTYEYMGDRPHAVTALKDDEENTLHTYEYDDNGNMTKVSDVTSIIISAKGTGVAVEPPLMELWVDGESVIRWIVSNTEYKDFSWHGYWDGSSTVDVVFVNDNTAGGVNTDLLVDFIIINGEKVESEDTVRVSYDRGGYPEGCFDGIDVSAGQETIGLTGALRYTGITALPFERTIRYDYENRITQINDNGVISYYSYDPEGQRRKKSETVNGVTTITYYFFTYYEEEVVDTVTTKIKYYYANDQKIAQLRKTDMEEELLYFHTDHLGSAVRLTDENGNIVYSIAYMPFGETAYASNTEGLKYQFTGQEKDKSGLYYYGARYYDPKLGRFIQPDPFLDGLNRYTYCRNNPVKYVDPCGNFIFSLFLPVIGPILDAACIGAVISAGINVVVQTINIISGNQESFDMNSFWSSFGVGAITGSLSAVFGGFIPCLDIAYNIGGGLGDIVFGTFIGAAGGTTNYLFNTPVDEWRLDGLLIQTGIEAAIGASMATLDYLYRTYIKPKDTLIINGPGKTSDELENLLIEAETKDPVWVRSANNEAELENILNNLPDGCKNVVIAGTHGDEVMAQISNILETITIDAANLTGLNIGDVNIYFATCYQGRVIPAMSINNPQGWAGGMGTSSVSNINGIFGKSYASISYRTVTQVLAGNDPWLPFFIQQNRCNWENGDWFLGR